MGQLPGLLSCDASWLAMPAPLEEPAWLQLTLTPVWLALALTPATPLMPRPVMAPPGGDESRN